MGPFPRGQAEECPVGCTEVCGYCLGVRAPVYCDWRVIHGAISSPVPLSVVSQCRGPCTWCHARRHSGIMHGTPAATPGVGGLRATAWYWQRPGGESMSQASPESTMGGGREVIPGSILGHILAISPRCLTKPQAGRGTERPTCKLGNWVDCLEAPEK